MRAHGLKGKEPHIMSLIQLHKHPKEEHQTKATLHTRDVTAPLSAHPWPDHCWTDNISHAPRCKGRNCLSAAHLMKIDPGVRNKTRSAWENIGENVAPEAALCL